MRLRDLSEPDHRPALDRRYASARPAAGLGPDDYPPRTLLLYGSLRETPYSRLAVEEAAQCCASSAPSRASSIPPTCLFPIR